MTSSDIAAPELSSPSSSLAVPPSPGRYRHSARNSRKRSDFQRLVSCELAPIAIVLLMVTLEMRHLARTSWMSFFLYGGDALTLPLFRESLAHHQLWMPVVSTQLLVFPEGVLYAICSAVTTSIRASLVANAYANIILLYLAVRSIAPTVIGRTGRRGAASAAFCVALVVLMLLEIEGGKANLQFATLNLLTTYYFGLVLGGIVLLAATVRQLRPTKRLIGVPGWTAVAVTVSTATYGSDPLFLLWVSVPIAVTSLVLLALRRVPARQVVVVIACQVVSVLAGTALRHPLSRFIGSSADSYVQFGMIGQALASFRSMIHSMWIHPSERVELVLLALILMTAVVQFVHFVRRPPESPATRASAALVIVTFALVAPMTDVMGILVSGNSTSRYFIPVFVFPLLAVIPLADQVLIRRPTTRNGAWRGAAVSGAAVAATVILIPGVQPLLDPGAFPGGMCFNQIAALRGRTGVGDFTTSRALEAYGSNGTHVLQVLPNLLPFGWLVNLGSFEHRELSFVVVDRTVGQPVDLVASDTMPLGSPTSVTSCPGFDVYAYLRGTHGHAVLNQIFATWDGEMWPPSTTPGAN